MKCHFNLETAQFHSYFPGLLPGSSASDWHIPACRSQFSFEPHYSSFRAHTAIYSASAPTVVPLLLLSSFLFVPLSLLSGGDHLHRP